MNQDRKYKVTRTYVSLIKGNWVITSEETSYEGKRFIDIALSDTAQPFEKSHRRFKQFAGSHRYDTYESVSPDGKMKFYLSVNFNDYQD